MDVLFWLAIWFSAVYASHLMAEKRARDKRWAIIGGLLFGWCTPLYYLIVGDSKILRSKKKEEERDEIKRQIEEDKKENVPY